MLRPKFINFNGKSLCHFMKWAVQLPKQGVPTEIPLWPETCNSRAAIVGRILPSQLQTSRFFLNVVFRHPNAASPAARQRKPIPAVVAAVVTARPRPTELLLSVQVVGSRRRCRLSRAVTARSFAVPATRRAKAAADRLHSTHTAGRRPASNQHAQAAHRSFTGNRFHNAAEQAPACVPACIFLHQSGYAGRPGEVCALCGY